MTPGNIADHEPEDRHSKALEAELISDPDALARQEARNGLRQFDAVMEMVDYFLQPEKPFRLRPSHLLHLHRIALDGISPTRGTFVLLVLKFVAASISPLAPSGSGESRGAVRLHKRELGIQTPDSFSSILSLASKLDTPVHRWEWKNCEGIIVLGVVCSAAIQASRNEHHSRPDFEK